MKLIDILVEELPRRGGWPKRANCITQDGDLRVEPASCHTSIAKCDEDGFWFLDSSRTGGFEVDTLASDYTTAIITREQYEAALAAKNDGWIEWGGGECPVPCGTMVDVKHRCGAVSENQQAWPKRHKESDVMVNPLSNAGQAFWRHENSVMDIIAYRLHQQTKSEQVRADAWNAYAGITEPDAESDLNECIGQDAAPVWNGEGLPPVGMEIEYSFAKVNYRTDFSRGKVLAYGMQNVFMEHWASKNEFIQPLDKIEFRPIRSEADKKREDALDAIYGAIAIAERAHNRSDEADKVYEAIAAGKIPGVKLED